jgi:xylulokinase
MIERRGYPDVGCLGAAIMASVGVGAHASLSEANSTTTKVERTFEPDPRFRARYDTMYDLRARHRLCGP